MVDFVIETKGSSVGEKADGRDPAPNPGCAFETRPEALGI